MAYCRAFERNTAYDAFISAEKNAVYGVVFPEGVMLYTASGSRQKGMFYKT